MGDLVIGDGKNLARAAVHQLEAQLLLDREPPARPKDPVQRDRARHRGDSILRKHHRAHPAPRVEINQSARHPVDRPKILPELWIIWPQPLQVVIEMRQVNERQVRSVPFLNPLGRTRDPLRRRDARPRTPKRRKRKRPEVGLDLLPQPHRLRVNVEHFAPVRRIHRSRRDRPVRARIHVIPPKQFRAGKPRPPLAQRLPDFFPLHHVVRLLPKLVLRQRAIIPAVGDATMPRRRQPREIRALRRARHRRQHRLHPDQTIRLRQRRKPRRLRPQHPRSEPHHVDDRGALRAESTIAGIGP